MRASAKVFRLLKRSVGSCVRERRARRDLRPVHAAALVVLIVLFEVVAARPGQERQLRVEGVERGAGVARAELPGRLVARPFQAGLRRGVARESWAGDGDAGPRPEVRLQRLDVGDEIDGFLETRDDGIGGARDVAGRHGGGDLEAEQLVVEDP